MSLLAGSPGSSNGDLEARYKAKAGLARLRLEKEERVSRLKLELEYRHKLEVRRLELESEAEVKVKIRRLELAAASASGQAGSTSSVQSTLRSSTFDVRHVSLVPPFRGLVLFSCVQTHCNYFKLAEGCMDLLATV